MRERVAIESIDPLADRELGATSRDQTKTETLNTEILKLDRVARFQVVSVSLFQLLR